MKELDSFTVERLEELARAKMISGYDIADIRALARIALAAKRAETIYFIYTGGGDYYGYAFVDKNENEIDIKDNQKLYLFPPISQLNHPEIPEGWKLTPINPTAEMMAAAMECDDVVYDLDDDTIFCVQFDNIYAAMLAAAPGKANG